MLVPVNELQFRSQASRADRENDSSSYHLFNYLLQSGPHKDSRKVTGPYRKRLKDQQLVLPSLGELRNKAQLSGLLSSPSPGAADRSAGARREPALPSLCAAHPGGCGCCCAPNISERASPWCLLYDPCSWMCVQRSLPCWLHEGREQAVAVPLTGLHPGVACGAVRWSKGVSGTQKSSNNGAPRPLQPHGEQRRCHPAEGASMGRKKAPREASAAVA